MRCSYTGLNIYIEAIVSYTGLKCFHQGQTPGRVVRISVRGKVTIRVRFTVPDTDTLEDTVSNDHEVYSRGS